MTDIVLGDAVVHGSASVSWPDEKAPEPVMPDNDEKEESDGTTVPISVP